MKLVLYDNSWDQAGHKIQRRDYDGDDRDTVETEDEEASEKETDADEADALRAENHLPHSGTLPLGNRGVICP